ncbi:MAG: hypothetical protein ACR2IP_02520 [Solirubrobacteraceae bacterium]
MANIPTDATAKPSTAHQSSAVLAAEVSAFWLATASAMVNSKPPTMATAVAPMIAA